MSRDPARKPAVQPSGCEYFNSRDLLSRRRNLSAVSWFFPKRQDWLGAPLVSKNESRYGSIRFRNRPHNARLQTRNRTFLGGRYLHTEDNEWKVA